MLYGTISEYCTKSGCPLMAAGDCRYLWADKKITKPIEVSAPEYVELLMSWVESQLNDEAIFPIKFDSSYPKKFHAICATIYKRFFRVYAHIYHAHFKQIQTLGADAHLNTCFKHFMSAHHITQTTYDDAGTHASDIASFWALIRRFALRGSKREREARRARWIRQTAR